MYPRAVGHAAIAALGRGRKVRLGAYGDPAAIPSYVNESLVSESAGHTAYSHQSAWEARTEGFLPERMMVSADSLSAATEAWTRSWRTFRVVGSVGEVVRGREYPVPGIGGGWQTDAVRELPVVRGRERAGEVDRHRRARRWQETPQRTREGVR